MKRLIAVSGAFFLALMFAAAAFAQGGRLEGQVLDKNGKPYPDVTVTIQNSSTNQTFTLKTDKNGKFTQIGLPGAIYKITLTNEADHLNYAAQFQVKDGQDNTLNINIKELMAQEAASPEAQKRKEEENAQKNMKANFDAGVKSMQAADAFNAQIHAAPAAQKAALQQQRADDCKAAANSFQEAEKGVGPKDVNNHATMLGNLGNADECAGQFDDAAAAYQKAVDLKPSASGYTGLGTNLAKAAVAQTDPKAEDAKIADASAACEKAGSLDPAAPAAAAPCWKNVGIVLFNKGDSKAAVAAFQKATQADPKDAQTWFLMGNALTGLIDSKEQGGKIIYIIPPDLKEAYQKCIDVDPSGPYAAQAKAMIAGLAQYSNGENITETKRKH